MSEYFHQLHASWGVELVRNATASQVLGSDGCPGGVELADGRKVVGDMVVVAVGVVPNCELAEASGIACANGIVVDDLLTTSDPDIHAVGDCVTFVPAGRTERLRLESVQNAVDGARAVAATLMHRPTPLTSRRCSG